MAGKNILLLFDVDGTLTPARQTIKPDMDEILKKLAAFVDVAVVSGSDLPKIEEQLSSPEGTGK